MKVYEKALFDKKLINRFENQDWIMHEAGLSKFADFFNEQLAAGSITWKNGIAIPSEFNTDSRMQRFVMKDCHIDRSCLKRIDKGKSDTLIFFEKVRYVDKYDRNTRTFKLHQFDDSVFTVCRIREATDEEIRVHDERIAELHSFDISKLNIKYHAIVHIESSSDANPSQLDGCRSEYFNAFEDAKAYVEKYRKAWHLQMTLKGLSSDIQHNNSCTLTVFKPGCSRKTLHSFNFWIKGYVSYERSNPIP